VRQVHLKLRSDDLTIQHLLRLARNACVAVGLHAAPAEVDDNLWLRMDAFDGLGQSARVDDDYDQDVIHSTDLQLVKNLQPKLGVFDLPCPKSEHFLASVGADAQCQIHGLVFDCAFVLDLQVLRAEINDRAHRFERPLLPLRDRFEHSVGYGRDQIRRDIGVIQLKQVRLHFAHAHPARVRVDDAIQFKTNNVEKTKCPTQRNIQ
jgi:hypothetical protein